MPTLYSLHLSRHVKGFGKPAIRSVETPGMTGHLCLETSRIVVPDHDTVREALPHYWRRAFDRAGRFWFPKDGAKVNAAHITLRDTRGRYLNTVYALPYRFPATNV